MVTGDRSVWAYTQNTWIQATSDPDPLWDLAASRSDDVWVVGDNGTLLHWPN